MKKAGGIIALIAGVLGLFAAGATLMIGGLGAAFEADGANTIVGLGWGGVFFCFLTIIFGTVAIGAKNKTPGVLLVISSILGAVLGGTLVAIFMALALIGGILAILGAPIIQNMNIETSTTSKSNKNLIGWGASAFIIGIIALGVSCDKNSTPKADPLAELEKAQPSAIAPNGELAEIFALGSNYTDLQRENKFKEIQGSVVVWRLPVYEVSRSGDDYKIQTQSEIGIGSAEALIGAYIYVTPRNNQDWQLIESLKTGDLVSIKGIIDDTTFRNLKIKPAILVVDKPDSSDSSPQASAEPVAAASNTCLEEKISAYRKEMGDEALIKNDIITEWEGECNSNPIEPAGSTFEEASSSPPDPCKSEAMFDMIVCANNDYEKVDAELNAIYKEVRNKLNAAGQAGLKTEQLQWIKQKETGCVDDENDADSPAGRAITLECWTTKTKERISQLKQIN